MQLLEQVSVESIVKLNENGAEVNYVVVHQGKPSSIYDDSCDGTWLLRQDIAENRQWDSGNSNVLESSDIQPYLNGTWINRYDTDIRNAIKQVKIPYRQGGGIGGTDQNGANGLSCKIFLLSGREVGFTSNESSLFPNDGSKLDYFISGNTSSAQQRRVAKLNGDTMDWWFRSANSGSSESVWCAHFTGDWSNPGAVSVRGIRQALILPGNLFVDENNNVIVPPDPPTLTVPQMLMQGQQVTVNWTAIEGADSYTLQRKSSADADWTQVYSGANTTFSETAGTWTTVQYRVQAVFDGTPGGWATSAEIPVVSASALVISGQDGDLGTLVNDVPYSISTDTGNQITATITVNGAVIFSGNVGNSTAGVIPVLDLINGAGTIVIEASVTASSGPVSAVRTWTYTKTMMTFPNAGSIAELTKDGKVMWPETLAEAVRIPGGKTLDQVMGFPAQVYAGSYVGTGTYGEDNPTEITFPFVPDFWGFTGTVVSGNSFFTPRGYAPFYPWGTKEISLGGAHFSASYSEKTVSLVSTSAPNQNNTTGTTYYFIGTKIS